MSSAASWDELSVEKKADAKAASKASSTDECSVGTKVDRTVVRWAYPTVERKAVSSAGW